MQEVRRKIRDAADADEQLAAARHAGVENREWAALNGICGRSLHIWMLLRRRHEPEHAPSQPRRQAFVELTTPAIVFPPIRVVTADLVVEVPVGCPPDVLVSVIRAVRC